MRSGAFKNLCHIQIYTVKWTYEPIWESIFSVFWASGVLKSIFPDLSAPKEARETKKIHLKFFIQKGLPPTWETTVQGSVAFFFWCCVLARGITKGAAGSSNALQWTRERISDISDISHVVLSQASSLAKNLLHTVALEKARVVKVKCMWGKDLSSWVKLSTN